MGTVTTTTIFANVDKILGDTAKTRWPDAEKLVYLNWGQKRIVILKPSANVDFTAFILAGGTKQALPSGGVFLIDIIRNMGTAPGNTPGDAIEATDKTNQDAFDPSWHSGTTSATVKSFIYDERYPKVFYVNPPQPAVSQGYIEAAVSKFVSDVTDGNAINLDDDYEEDLTNYILYRCYAKDAALSPLNAARAHDYWNQFVQGLGRMDLIKQATGPNVKNPDPSPSTA